jgi:glycosyltransferase involved in cell wall biosynthesis
MLNFVMRVLLIHHEAEYFAGAEKMLGYFLQGLVPKITVSVAAVRESRVAELIPSKVPTCWLPPNAQFSLPSFYRQLSAVRQFSKAQPFDLVHGWAARDWELVAATSRLLRRPAVATLHDHPHASFISRTRQRLMAWSVKVGLNQVVCVSEAVRQACIQARYSPVKLSVVRNGLPPISVLGRPAPSGSPFRLGYLGLFSERKGLRGLFSIVDELARLTTVPWTLVLAGDAQSATERALVEEIKAQSSNRPWWPQVEWRGWVKQPLEFLSGLDLLICPSSDFDPFPTVLLEAGQAGLPVLAASIGGVPEIIEDQKTGWLFAPRMWGQAAKQLQQLLASPELARQAGLRARQRVQEKFSVERMVAEYLSIYGVTARGNLSSRHRVTCELG